MPPFFVISLATNPILRTFKDRCSFENPNSLERCVRTISPSSSDTGRRPSSSNFTRRPLARVDLPDPDKPVKKIVKPLFESEGRCFCNSEITSG